VQAVADSRLARALGNYRQVVRARLADATAQANAGVDAMAAGDAVRALACADTALAAGLNEAAVHFNRATALSALERHAEAVPAWDRALELGLDGPDVHNSRGLSLYKLSLPVQAVASYRRALERATGALRANVLNSLGFALQDLRELDDAVACYREALALAPGFAMARLNLGLACLTLGRWDEGWALYESRWQGSAESARDALEAPSSALPLWSGQDPAPGDALLVLPEQGLGDLLQMARLLPLAAQRFARVSLVCPPPLLRLMAHSLAPGIEVLDAPPESQQSWQWHCPVMSLPRAFGLRPDAVPGPHPYLRVAKPWARRWQPRLDSLDGMGRGRLRAGLAWAGRADHAADARRSIALARLGGLLQLPGVCWVSLQKAPQPPGPDPLAQAAGMVDWTADFADMADTAAVIAGLDLVVCVDSSVAHLAGALGKPVWLLNRFESEWRWLDGRTDSPWYPSMRLFTQRASGDWDEVLARVAAALRPLAA